MPKFTSFVLPSLYISPGVENSLRHRIKLDVMGKPFSFTQSFGKRIFLIFLLFLLLSYGLTCFFSLSIIENAIKRETSLRLKLALHQLKASLQEIYFQYQSSVFDFSSPELKYVVRKEALKTIKELAEELHLECLVLEGEKKPLLGVPEAFERNTTLREEFFFEPFGWRIKLGIPNQTLSREIYQALRYYLLIIVGILVVALLVTYFVYLHWVKRPISQVIEDLEEKREPEHCGIQEFDLLVDKIKEALERERELSHKLAFTEKMSALGVMAGGYAHEFNNLLQIIAGEVSLAKTAIQKEEIERALKRLDRVEEAVIRGAEISGRLLRLSRKEVKDKKEISNLHEAVTNTLEALRAGLSKKLKLEVSLPEDVFTPLSAEEWQEIITNLVLNAQDAMGGEGTVSIRAEREGDRVVLFVCDTGPGIPDELKTRVFEPFFTTKEPGKGTGLGLFIIQQIISQAGGEITILDNPSGKGTCFKIVLPIVSPPEGREETTDLGLSLLRHLGKTRILVVDDEDYIRQNLKEGLALMGFEVEETSQAEKALEKLKQNHYDLVLLDLLMPGKDGAWLLEHLKDLQNPPAVVLMSGYAGKLKPEVEKFFHLGLVKRAVRKPFRLETLKEILGEVILESQVKN